MDDHTMASSSAHNAKNNLRQRRKRDDKPAYDMPGSPAPEVKICDRYGDPPLKPALIPLARALILFDVKLLRRVQKFYQKRVSSLDEALKAPAVRWVERCNEIQQQWKDIDSGQRQFSQLYMRSNQFVPYWAEGLRIIKEALRSNQISGNQRQKHNDYGRILAGYEDLANNLNDQMVDTARQGLLETEIILSIQERWVRLDETLDWYYNLCNFQVDEDEPRVFRSSVAWSEVRRMVQTDNLRTRSDKELIQIQPASSSKNATDPDTTARPRESKTDSTAIFWIIFFSCSIAFLVLFIGGYQRSLHLPGAANDADFWFLIQATFMQILGLTVAALLEWKHGGLPTWRWALPAAIAGACSIMAIPLYLIVPKEWSTFLSLLAGAIQSFITLQFFLF